MKFDTLKDRMEYFRSLADYRLMPNSYVVVMVDGRGFSKSVKKLFEKPFDDKFISMMNNTDSFLRYRLCKIQSIIVGIASTVFNYLYIENILSLPASQEDIFR